MRLMKTTLETKPWDIVNYLTTEEDIAAYLEAALEEGDVALLLTAVHDIARAKNMTSTLDDIAQQEGVSFNDFIRQDRPDLGKVLKVIQALGITLQVKLNV